MTHFTSLHIYVALDLFTKINKFINVTLELLMKVNLFVLTKHTCVYHLKIRGEKICQNFNKRFVWQFEEKTHKFCSNQIMIE